MTTSRWTSASASRPRAGAPLIPRTAIAVAVVVVVAVGLLAYRSVSAGRRCGRRWRRRRSTSARHRRRIQEGRGDPRAVCRAGSARDGGHARVRAGMLALDYRDAAAADEAEGLLVKPERADPIPRWANLARAALALSKGEAGTAMTAASRVPGDPVAGDAGGADRARGRQPRGCGGAPPLRRRRRAAAARRARRSTATSSGAPSGTAGPRRPPTAGRSPAPGQHVHARAAFGLAKLALTGQVPPAEATGPLRGWRPTMGRLPTSVPGPPSTPRRSPCARATGHAPPRSSTARGSTRPPGTGPSGRRRWRPTPAASSAPSRGRRRRCCLPATTTLRSSARSPSLRPNPPRGCRRRRSREGDQGGREAGSPKAQEEGRPGPEGDPEDGHAPLNGAPAGRPGGGPPPCRLARRASTLRWQSGDAQPRAAAPPGKIQSFRPPPSAHGCNSPVLSLNRWRQT